MGEYADQIINGECCALCMAPFISGDKDDSVGYVEGFEHGYPVACKDCWEPDCGYQKATADTI